ncbi:MAG: hypothetical protein JSS97_05440, partial [Actinobacteria bacterium]|nr:hypothetical protein [Actinomycetota bacterium]
MTSRGARFGVALTLLAAILAVAMVTAGPALAGPALPGGEGGGCSSATASATTCVEEEGLPTEGEAEMEGGATSDSNPLSTLGGGSHSHPFPLDNYGLDEQVQWGVSHLGNTFDRITQWVIQGIWQLMLYVFNGIMVMLRWAFSLDLLQKSMSKLTDALQTMRENIDTPWGLAAVAAMALWGIWNGLVRNKSIDTLRGLTASLLCMAALLVVIGNPVETLGQFTSAANGASTEMLSSITGGSVSHPQQAVGSTEESLFDTVILRPWCALQFADIEYCLSQPKGLNQSVADTWLQAPPDSEWRTSLWNITKSSSEEEARDESYGIDAPGKNTNLGDMYHLAGNPQKVALISGDSTFSRLGLLLLIVVGLVGAICLFCYLSVRLLMAALFVLILVMFAPAMFLVAALGDTGRATVFAWLKRVCGAVLTKVVFALFLAVIIAAGNLVAELNLGFFPEWIVFIALWWGVLLKRKDLLALLSLDTRAATPSGIDFNGAGGGHSLAELFYARQLMGDARRGARRLARGATAAPRVVGRRGREAVGRGVEGRRLGESDAARRLAREDLEGEGRAALKRRNAERHQTELADSARVLGREKRLSTRLADLDSQIRQKRAGTASRQRNGARPEGRRLEGLTETRAQVQQELHTLRSSPEYDRARSAGGSRPREVTDGDVQGWITQRRSELSRRPDAPENLRAAGIDPQAFKRAGSDEQGAARARSSETMKRHQALFERAGLDGGAD